MSEMAGMVSVNAAHRKVDQTLKVKLVGNSRMPKVPGTWTTEVRVKGGASLEEEPCWLLTGRQESGCRMPLTQSHRVSARPAEAWSCFHSALPCSSALSSLCNGNA